MKNIFSFFFPKSKSLSIEPKTEVEIKVKSEPLLQEQPNFSEATNPELIRDKR